MRDKLVQEDKLNAQLVNYLRGRLNSDHPVFGPFRVFMDMAKADYHEIEKKSAEIAENKGNRYNSIIADAFRDQRPQNLDDVAKIYEKAFASMEAKSKDAYKAVRAAADKTKPASDHRIMAAQPA